MEEDTGFHPARLVDGRSPEPAKSELAKTPLGLPVRPIPLFNGEESTEEAVGIGGSSPSASEDLATALGRPTAVADEELTEAKEPRAATSPNALLKQSERPTGWSVTLVSDHGAGLVSAVEGVRRHTQVRNKPQELYLC